MLTSQEKDFLENNREYLEGDLTLVGFYNKAAYHLGINTGKKLTILYAEASGNYKFKVRVLSSGSTKVRYFYKIVSRVDPDDQLKLYETLPTSRKYSPREREEVMKGYIQSLGILFSNLSNLKEDAEY